MKWNPRNLKTVHTSNKELSKKSEKRLAKSTGSRLTPASGALPHVKGDAMSAEFLYEDKATRADSFRVTKHLLEKLTRQAAQHNKLPAMRVQLPTETVFVLPERTFIEILEKIKHE